MKRYAKAGIHPDDTGDRYVIDYTYNYLEDINTSGSTIDEILRVIGKINNSCNIYVYTLIGK